jgi:hypothetical protein
MADTDPTAPDERKIRRRKVYAETSEAKKAYCLTHKEQTAAAGKRWCDANREHVTVRNKVFRDENPQYNRTYNKANRARLLAKKLGVSEEDILRLEQLHDRCVICKTPFTLVKPVIDHCHHSKKLRSRICFQCNIMLGMAKDSPKILMAAARYLKAHAPKESLIVDESHGAQSPVVDVENH